MENKEVTAEYVRGLMPDKINPAQAYLNKIFKYIIQRAETGYSDMEVIYYGLEEDVNKIKIELERRGFNMGFIEHETEDRFKFTINWRE